MKETHPRVGNSTLTSNQYSTKDINGKHAYHFEIINQYKCNDKEVIDFIPKKHKRRTTIIHTEQTLCITEK